MSLPALKILLASPRGFCAGVTRAVSTVEVALKKYGGKVYVRHEIVHNKYVVDLLARSGAVFVSELDEVPDGAAVILSAHGVPQSVKEEAKRRGLKVIDATCPLVEKVHREARKNYENGTKTLLIGHEGHPEVIGTMGQIPKDSIMLISSEKDIDSIPQSWRENISYVTQTTLSLDETQVFLDALKAKIPHLKKPYGNDICYATTNRQRAVKSIAQKCDAVMVIGSPNSSNSKRLAEVAKEAGCPKSVLVQRASEIDWDEIGKLKTLGVTAGASAPQVLVQEVLDEAGKRFDVTLEEFAQNEEHVKFALPDIPTE